MEFPDILILDYFRAKEPQSKITALVHWVSTQTAPFGMSLLVFPKLEEELGAWANTIGFTAGVHLPLQHSHYYNAWNRAHKESATKTRWTDFSTEVQGGKAKPSLACCNFRVLFGAG